MPPPPFPINAFSSAYQICYPDLYLGILAPGERVWFHVYLVRTMAWALAVVPASVLYAAAKLSFLPVLVFGSLDPEHATHVSFYREDFASLFCCLCCYCVCCHSARYCFCGCCCCCLRIIC